MGRCEEDDLEIPEVKQEDEEMEQAEEFTVSGDEGTDETVEAGRDALGNGEEEEESEAAAEVALESSELQGDIEDDSTEAEVRKVLKNDDHWK